MDVPKDSQDEKEEWEATKDELDSASDRPSEPETGDSAFASMYPPRKLDKRRTINEEALTPDELRRLELRRAYNRKCAANARKRSKDLITTLQEQIDQLTKDKADLQRDNEILKAQNAMMKTQMELLESRNRNFIMQASQSQPLQGSLVGQFAPAGATSMSSMALPALPEAMMYAQAPPASASNEQMPYQLLLNTLGLAMKQPQVPQQPPAQPVQQVHPQEQHQHQQWGGPFQGGDQSNQGGNPNNFFY